MDIRQQFQNIRQQSIELCEGLSSEDMTAQSMPDASPIKWHLAHTTWFFETFVLLENGYRAEDPQFQYLFNSYYHSKGEQYQRSNRGLITRPLVEEVLDYRLAIEEKILKLLERNEPDINSLVEVGLHHEMQHQELMLTDLLHLFSKNPLCPALFPAPPVERNQKRDDSKWVSFEEQLIEVGAKPENGFAYDCESPNHKTWLTPFSLVTHLVTNVEWIEFMSDGGYSDPMLWLSDGWEHRQNKNWQSPAYWQKKDGVWLQFGLDGLRELNPHAPVCHISYFEAQAYAQWAGKRLPREHELEYVSPENTISGNFLESKYLRPQAAKNEAPGQLYGDVWEWTQSAYLPYPGFKAEQGGLGEYNGKFMCGQFVLRGGSCVTPTGQMRASYRNFFYPWQRWQFTGFRLAEDLE